MTEEKRGGPRKEGHRYVQVPAELLNRARLIPEVNVSAVCAAAIEAACEAVKTGEPRTVTFGFKLVRALSIDAGLADPPKPEER